ncbi:MAG TPA: histidine kinase dimerization/phospho-acceptor domain-containing protein [Anaeromyxobacter sp.]|nr:histidine kinase dimerization/phospho-acceptor domain-containing protein [Anaeromyxobacter sp.]
MASFPAPQLRPKAAIALAAALVAALALLAGAVLAIRPRRGLELALLMALSAAAALVVAAGVRAARRGGRAGTLAEAVGRIAGKTSLVGMGRATLEGRILACNEAMARLLGARSARDLVGSDVRSLYRDALQREAILGEVRRRGQASGVEVQARGRDGVERTLLLDVAAEGGALTTLAVDATERERVEADRGRLEHQLHEAHRKEEVGRLARGVAHDFNNLLTVIVGYAAALREELGEDDPRREGASGILQAANRAAGLARSLLAFGRGPTEPRRAVDLREVVRAAREQVGDGGGSVAGVEVELPEAPLPVLADADLLAQALVDLCGSARGAVPAGGRLRIAVDAVELDLASARARRLAGAGRFARLRLLGPGGGAEAPASGEPPPAEPPRSGDAPGLSIAFGIVRQHGGQVELSSAPAAGITVTLLFPLAGGAPPAG